MGFNSGFKGLIISIKKFEYINILISCGDLVEYHIVKIYRLDQNYALLPKILKYSIKHRFVTLA